MSGEEEEVIKKKADKKIDDDASCRRQLTNSEEVGECLWTKESMKEDFSLSYYLDFQCI